MCYNKGTAGCYNSSYGASLSNKQRTKERAKKMAKNKYGIEMWNEGDNLSHNICYEENEIASTCFNKYLILIENENTTEIIPCTCLTTAIEIASNEKSLCRLFERRGSMGKHWSYLCDISKGVI